MRTSKLLVDLLGGFMLTILAIGGISCKSLRVGDVPGGTELMDATAYLAQLKSEGKLPGINQNEHGNVRSVPLPLNTTSENMSNLTFRATINGKEGLVYWYRVVKSGEPQAWTLVEAWQVDDHGRRIDLAVSKN